MLAGEPELAEAVLRESCTVVDRHNDEPALSTIAAAVGEALYCQDRHDEARDWSRLARERAPEADKISQVCWRSLEAKLLARDGLGQAAERMAGEALALIETTDALSQRGNVLLDTAIVLASTGHPAEAAGRIERAIGLFEAKENVASSRLAQSRLAAVAVG